PPDPTIGQEQEQALQAFLDGIATLRGREQSSTQKLAEAANLPGAANLSASFIGTILAFDAPTFNDFRERALRGLDEIMARPVVPGTVRDQVNAYLDANQPGQTNELAALRDLLRV